VHFMLSHRLKGKRSLRRRQRLPLHPNIPPSPLLRTALQLGIIFTHMLFAKGRETKRAYTSLKYPFFAIHAKGGESISPKQKNRTTTNFKNVVFQICIKRRFFNWYLIFDRIFKLVLPLPKLISKTLLNTKRRISLKGSFV
jgi:hypothetical protein